MTKGEKLPLLPSDLISPGAHAAGDRTTKNPTQTQNQYSLRLLLLLLASSILLYISPPIPALDSLSFSSFLISHRHPSPIGLQHTSDSKRKFPDVEFDKSSMILLGQRVVIQSGEFHPWRLPVTDLWRDILQKAHAGGLNTISIYTHWGLINPSPGVFDWTGFRDLALFLDIAQEVGLWVIVRPGPYINAETTAGGLPGWVTTIKGQLRTNATDYREAWEPYLRQVCQITKSYQISEGGPVILMQVENELAHEVGQPEHFNEISEVMRSEGIVVPLTFNDWAMQDFYASGDAAADIYGFDNYPQGFDCSHPTVWAPVEPAYAPYHARVNGEQPLYIPEFQGGAFDAWGPGSPGYGKCEELTGRAFESVFYKHLWASNVKMLSIYMLYGGTSWGLLAFPGVYTSYDYGAAISESRLLTPKYDELKRQSLFLRSVREFANTKIVGNHTDQNEGKGFWTELRNPETGAGFYVVRQLDSSSTEDISFDMTVRTSAGRVSFDQKTGTSMRLKGRQSRVVTTDISYGKNSKLLYTSAEILFAGTVGDRDILFVHGDVDTTFTASFDFPVDFSAQHSSIGPAYISPLESGPLHSFLFNTTLPSLSALSLSKTQLVLFADTETAGTFWNPLISSTSSGRANFFSFGTNETILVGGPYLVRNATMDGTILSLTGDLQTGSTTKLIVLASEAVKSIEWNGISVELEPWDELSRVGALVGRIAVGEVEIVLPELKDWKYMDSLPEIQEEFDDSDWIVAKEGKLNNPYPPLYGDLWLYSCEYEFCEGATFWRGAFKGSKATGVNLSLSGGEAFAGSVWINDHFLGTSFGNSTNNENIVATTNETFYFPNEVLKEGKNIVTVLVDNMGQDEGNESPKHPRGVQGYALLGDQVQFDSWKVQGKNGGNINFPDKVRGITNEGGFFAERSGWHLPTFDSTSWSPHSPLEGTSEAGVAFYRTTVDLDIPAEVDLPINLSFGGLDENGDVEKSYRAMLWVNGWSFGKFVSNLGPQTDFPIPPGILNQQGSNTIALLVWAMGREGAKVEGFKLTTGKSGKSYVGPALLSTTV